MPHGDLCLLFRYVFACRPTSLACTCVHPHLLPVPLAGCCCRDSLVSVDAGALPSLPTGGRGASHLGDVDGSLPVCCDTDPGAENSFTFPEGDAEFLGVVLVRAHVIDDACRPDALDEYMVSWGDGSGGYSHHDYCFCLFPVIWLLVEVLLGLCLLATLCAVGYQHSPFLFSVGYPSGCDTWATGWHIHHMTTLSFSILLISSSS